MFKCVATVKRGNKGGLKAALRQGNNWQYVACNIFLVMLPVITKKCCGQHVANCCLGVRPALHQGNNWQHVACDVGAYHMLPSVATVACSVRPCYKNSLISDEIVIKSNTSGLSEIFDLKYEYIFVSATIFFENFTCWVKTRYAVAAIIVLKCKYCTCTEGYIVAAT
jgi:hypothetical protein